MGGGGISGSWPITAQIFESLEVEYIERILAHTSFRIVYKIFIFSYKVKAGIEASCFH